MQIMGGRECAGLEQQACGRLPAFRFGGLERLGFEAVAVGLVEQLLQYRGELGGELAGDQFALHALDLLLLQALFLGAGQRGGEDVRRGLAETPLALAMEMDGRGEQLEQHRCGFHGRGRMAEVVGGEVGKAELVVAAHFPQEIGFHAGAFGLGTGDQLACSGGIEAQQHVRGLEFDALAGGGFHLQRAVVVSEDAAGLERAVLFKKHIHGAGLLT